MRLNGRELLQRVSCRAVLTAPAEDRSWRCPKRPHRHLILDRPNVQLPLLLSATTMLCTKCQPIFDDWGSWRVLKGQGPNLTHHSISALRTSARHCRVCALFLKTVDDVPEDEEPKIEVREWIGVDGYFSVELIWTSVGSRAAAGVELSEAFGKVLHLMFKLTFLDDDDIGSIASETNSKACWSLARRWLNQCRSHSCSPYLEKIPTRLVDVGSSDDEIRLVYADDVEWLTLSHCWGGLQFTTLLKENLESFMHQIPKDALTKTFRDAMTTTRALGFRYIWIDSLCIIQDDPIDWEKEAVLMASVYGGSSLNLAAVDAPDGTFGCFSSRKPGIEACKIRINGTTWNCVPRLFAPSLTTDTPLGRRGWVLQETLLAPRTLYMGRQLVWACRELNACESFPHGISCRFSPWIDWRNLVDAWFEVVHNYSSRALTFPKDKFNALSGVSQLFAATFNATFNAGLWTTDLAKQLIWMVETDPSLRPTYQAPTWSWASIEGRVALPAGLGNDFDVFVTVQDISVDSTTPFGPVKDGRLVLRSRAPLRVSVVSKEGKWWTITTGDVQILARVYLDTSEEVEEMLFLPIIRLRQPEFDLVTHGIIIKSHAGVFNRVGYFGLDEDSQQTFNRCCAEENLFDIIAASDDEGEVLYDLIIV